MDAFTLQGDPFRPPKKKKDREPEREPERPKAPTGPFNVVITEDAQREFDGLPANVQEGMTELFDRLKAWPEVSGTRRLFGKGYAANKFRMKTWDWRMEFLLDEPTRTITVIRIGHRDDFYDEYH